MSSPVPYRQIRAHFDNDYITVYQAYKASIAEAATSTQKLNASPDFRPGRMTWIKPSWSWMMYRAGYSYKDAGQERILAIKMKHSHFLDLLENAVLTSHGGEVPTKKAPRSETDGFRQKSADVKIQWDPERSVKLEVLPYRSIQIGIPGALSDTWARQWIAKIEDVTDKARALKKAIDERPDITDEELAEMDLVPLERPYPVSEGIEVRLQMGTPDSAPSGRKARLEEFARVKVDAEVIPS